MKDGGGVAQTLLQRLGSEEGFGAGVQQICLINPDDQCNVWGTLPINPRLSDKACAK